MISLLVTLGILGAGGPDRFQAWTKQCRRMRSPNWKIPTMRNGTWFVIPTLVVGTFVGCSAISSQEQKEPAPSEARSTSKLYDSFDAEKLGQAHSSFFDEDLRRLGVVANLTITPPGDRFKLFRIRGNISDEDLKKAIDSIRADLDGLAKTSGVQIVHEAKADMRDRPIALLSALFIGHTIDVNSIHGFYFTYEEDKIVGAVDVLAIRCVGEDAKQWKVVCSVHESER